MKTNLHKAQAISREIKATYYQDGSFKTVYASNEIQLIKDLKKVVIDNDSNLGSLYQGYEYIQSFSKALNNGKELSKAQLTQAKRLSLQIKIASAISELY